MTSVSGVAAAPPLATRWIAAARPRTLPAAVAPVLVGSACALHAGGFAALPAVAALLVALLLQVGTNFVNDWGDFRRGADGPDRVGPARAVAAGWITPRAMALAGALAFGAAALLGIYLTLRGGPLALALGVLSIAAGVAYTAGPFPLAYRGLGEVFVFAFFGPVAVCGTELVQRGAVSQLALAASVPVGLLAAAILVVNNVRDVDTDARAGKRTIAVRLGAARNLELLAGAYDPRIADRTIDAADGAFDTLLTAGFAGGRRESLPNMSFTGTEVTDEDFYGVSAGVSRQLRNGGRLAAVFTADRLRSNSAVVERNPSWTSGLSVEYAQPLLRGAGDVAMADVRRAQSASRAADHAFDALTDNVLLQIEAAYWELAFAHAQLRARRKSEAVAENLLAETQTRFDARVATVLDLADARAGLESRRGDRLLVEGALRKAEDLLRALVLPYDGSTSPKAVDGVPARKSPTFWPGAS